MRDNLGVYTMIQAFFGIVIGVCISNIYHDMNSIDNEALIDKGVAYYESNTGELIIKNIKEAVNDRE